LPFPPPLPLVVAAIAADVGVVGATRVGPGGGGAAPTRAGAARASRSKEGIYLFIVGQAKFLENQHVMGSGECGKNNGVGDVVGGVGEARIEATQ
jgi:hypothetical protein